MAAAATHNRRLWQAALVIGGWTLFGLFFASQAYLNQVYWGRDASWAQALWVWLPCGYSWALLTPAMLYLTRRFPFTREVWRRSLAVHLLAALCSSSFAVLVYVAIRKLLLWNDPSLVSPVQSFRNLLVNEFHVGILIYATVVGIRYAVAYYQKYRERELQAAQLESQLAQAQLEALRKQLQPHFLFNTLNTVAILIDEDTRAARNMLVRLSDLLRVTLDRARAHEVTLKQELEFIEGYLEIERTRFHDRLSVVMEIEPQTLSARVPDLILQPIVENAIRHGIAPRAAAGRIEIRAARQNGSLRLQVRDNGGGLPVTPPLAEQAANSKGVGVGVDGGVGIVVGGGESGGVGIANTRARLAQLYGDRQRLEMENLAAGGLLVTITMPFHTEASATTAAESPARSTGQR